MDTKRVIGSESSPNADSVLVLNASRAESTSDADVSIACPEYVSKLWQTGTGADF